MAMPWAEPANSSRFCDVKIASDRAMLGEPEIRLGYGAPFLMTPYSVNLAMAKEMMLTGDTIDAYEAARIGMVNRVVPHDNLMDECRRVANKMRNIPGHRHQNHQIVHQSRPGICRIHFRIAPQS